MQIPLWIKVGRMKWIALTGGLGSGKSTMAKLLRSRGYTVIDADQLAREVVAPGQMGLTKVLEHFGSKVRAEDGSLDRKKLGQIVFQNPSRLRELEGIIHPLVQKLAREQREQAEGRGEICAFYDVPLLYEKGLEKEFAAVIVVNCSVEQQIERAMARDQLSRDEVLLRVASQIPLAEKARRAQFVVSNNGSLWELEKEVDRLLTHFSLNT